MSSSSSTLSSGVTGSGRWLGSYRDQSMATQTRVSHTTERLKTLSILSEMQVTNNSTKYVKISKKEKKSARQTTK